MYLTDNIVSLNSFFFSRFLVIGDAKMVLKMADGNTRRAVELYLVNETSYNERCWHSDMFLRSFKVSHIVAGQVASTKCSSVNVCNII